jgi:lipoprotein-releasing system permease protein
MIGTTALKYSLRSLSRNIRRTSLSVLGVAIGCAIGIFAKAWYSGATDWQIRAASESGIGHLQIVNDQWLAQKENKLRVSDWRRAVDIARAEPGVVEVSPRIRAFGLLALGNRTATVTAVGLEPEPESKSNRAISRAKIDGRFLETDERGGVVIGRGLAATLGSELDDRLVLTLSGRDEVESAMLTVVGIVRSGLDSIDDAACYVGLADLERLTGREGVGEIGIMLSSLDLIEPVRAALAPKLPAGNQLITWGEVATLFSTNIESDTAFFDFMIFVIMFVVMLFIMSAQLSAVLERKREFAVLSALGMRSRSVWSVILIEGVFTGVLGALFATLIGGALAYWLSLGVNIEEVFGASMDSFGVVLDPVVYGDLGVWIVWYSLVVCTIATVAASVVPAWKATKVDPAEALRMV